MVRTRKMVSTVYLLKNKGVDFVKGVVKEFPGLKRPAISNPTPENKLQGLQKLVKNQPPTKRQPPFPPFIDPRGVTDVKEKVEGKCCWVKTWKWRNRWDSKTNNLYKF